MNSKKALARLKEIVGEEKYAEIIDAIGGSTIYFPEGGAWADRAERNVQLKEDFYSGLYDVVDLAQKYGISISSVYKIVRAR